MTHPALPSDAASAPAGPPGLHNTQGRSRVGTVLFDAQDGHGATPDGGNVDYMGFTVMMRPTQFLRLVPRLDELNPKIAEVVEGGAAIAPAMLYVDLTQRNENAAKVCGHEGRNRMTAILALQGDEPVPVQVIARGGDRARHITPAQIEAFRDVAITQRRPGEVVTERRHENFSQAFHLGNVLAVPNLYDDERSESMGLSI